ncbi:HlyD family efflux transporter periplasmic adaptor subunit [Luteipulveratus mongoliensis]|uniref:HlyD family efflux transporter periplasmic adaptor subunit n=1 Tax=Luteipulveratus mongoliensis TaxID=571913 RepID=UPI000695EC3A|nr:HlyD family efflux transporter periplasmic adaptor subunit [Luteipulveratus mongoliensis]
MQFRGRALQKMREPDELDRPVVLVDPRGWTSVFVVLILAIGAGLWAVTGRLPLTTSAPGFLTSHGGTHQLSSPYEGSVTEIKAQPGQVVTAGQTLLVVSGHGTAGASAPVGPHWVKAPFDGRVINVSTAVGDLISRGRQVITLERRQGANDPIIAYVFVPSDKAGAIRKGMNVHLAVDGIPKARFGLLRGTVEDVGAYPVDEDGVRALVGSSGNAKELSSQGSVTAVTVALKKVDSTYDWTAVTGRSVQLTTQRVVSAEFSLGSRTPFDVLLGVK